MLKEISYAQAEELWADGTISRVLYVYPDGTDAYIEENTSHIKLARHYKNGGKFAIEIDECIPKECGLGKITEQELMNLPFATKVKTVWQDDGLELLGVIFGDKIGYESGFMYRKNIMSNSMKSGLCTTYLMEQSADGN